MEELAVTRLFKKCKLSVFGPAAVFMLVLSGCAVPGWFTIGGTIPAHYNEGQKANFGGEFNACNLESPWGHVTYHDRSTDPKLRLEGDVTNAEKCASLSEGGEISVACAFCEGKFGDLLHGDEGSVGAVEIWYRSQDRRNFADEGGKAYVCVVDNGEGVNAEPDRLAIWIASGPYAGYFNHGDVQGNIDELEC